MALIELNASGNIGEGGDRIFQFGDYMVHVFLKDGMFYLPSTKSCDVLLVGGGGSGGASNNDNDCGSGGGGAGGALWREDYSISSGYYTIKVGRGGRSAPQGAFNSNGHFYTTQNGEHTEAFSVQAMGGGCGGGSDNHKRAQEGGCGGGAGSRNSNSGWNTGRGSAQGTFSGWTAYTGSGGNGADLNCSGAGGGGIGGNGSDQSGGSNSSSSQGGAGGAGRDFGSYFGRTVGHNGWFGGGGGGGTYRHGTDTSYNAPPNNGASNFGGGGYGVSARESSQNRNSFNVNLIHGMNGTGGGGGGGVENAYPQDDPWHGACHGRGGDGVVIIRYAL